MMLGGGFTPTAVEEFCSKPLPIGRVYHVESSEFAQLWEQLSEYLPEIPHLARRLKWPLQLVVNRDSQSWKGLKLDWECVDPRNLKLIKSVNWSLVGSEFLPGGLEAFTIDRFIARLRRKKDAGDMPDRIFNQKLPEEVKEGIIKSAVTKDSGVDSVNRAGIQELEYMSRISDASARSRGVKRLLKQHLGKLYFPHTEEFLDLRSKPGLPQVPQEALHLNLPVVLRLSYVNTKRVGAEAANTGGSKGLV